MRGRHASESAPVRCRRRNVNLGRRWDSPPCDRGLAAPAVSRPGSADAALGRGRGYLAPPSPRITGGEHARSARDVWLIAGATAGRPPAAPRATFPISTRRGSPGLTAIPEPDAVHRMKVADSYCVLPDPASLGGAVIGRRGRGRSRVAIVRTRTDPRGTRRYSTLVRQARMLGTPHGWRPPDRTA